MKLGELQKPPIFFWGKKQSQRYFSSGNRYAHCFAFNPICENNAMCFVLKPVVTNVNSIFPLPNKIIISNIYWALLMLQAQNSLKKLERICIWVSTVKMQWALLETLQKPFPLSHVGTCECRSGSHGARGRQEGSCSSSIKRPPIVQILLDYSFLNKEFVLRYQAWRHSSVPCNHYLDFPLFG